MTDRNEQLITVNKPFYSLEPLTDYLTALDVVTTNPTEDAIQYMKQTDAILTGRAVLFAETHYVHNEGYRIFGYRSCTVSDGVEAHAKLALHEPGSEAYYDEHAHQFRLPGALDVSFESETPRVDMAWHSVPREQVRLDEGSISRRIQAARSSLISLGGHLAVSGAFTEREIKPAYQAIRASIELLSEHSTETDFAMFGFKRISRDLLNQRWWISHHGARQNPIGKREALGNIKSAWNVVGRPYGKLSGLVSAAATRPNF